MIKITTKDELDKIHKNLTATLEKYIKTIISTYGRFIPNERFEYLSNINDYSNIIQIFDYSSINGYANNKYIALPLSADKAFDELKKITGYGTDESHKVYDSTNLIINDNTFMTYINHVIKKGVTLEDYFEDLLLHEIMHFCGSGGSTALMEGINELLTRKIALENNFKTSGCGYPKEVRIAYTLQEILGEDIINQIAFINNELDILNYLEDTIGKEASDLYLDISGIMNNEFQEKYYKDMNTYNGLKGIKKKIENYQTIDYTKAYELIEEYNKNMKVSESNHQKL